MNDDSEDISQADELVNDYLEDPFEEEGSFVFDDEALGYSYSPCAHDHAPMIMRP